jgi:hypothetical protein
MVMLCGLSGMLVVVLFQRYDSCFVNDFCWSGSNVLFFFGADRRRKAQLVVTKLYRWLIMMSQAFFACEQSMIDCSFTCFLSMSSTP